MNLKKRSLRFVPIVSIFVGLLWPSKSIREGFPTVQLLTSYGEVKSGMLVRENEKNIVLRDLANLQAEITIEKADVETRSNSKISMMPEGLVASLKSQREFLDLLSYLFDIHKGGPEKADELKPSAELLMVKDDTANLNHAKIIQKIESGKSALSPSERYEVVSYIRNRFMKGSNPDYQTLTEEYLQSLPQGAGMGEFRPAPDRDYGPALASQIGQDIRCALSIKLGDITIAYDLHIPHAVG